MVATVLDLGRDWKKRVLIEELSPEGRVPTEFDEPNPRCDMEWSRLTLPGHLQREETARWIGSYDAEDGWIEFERIA